MTPGTVTVNSDGSVTGTGAALIIYNGILAQQRQSPLWPATVSGGTTESYGVIGGTDIPDAPPTGTDPNTASPPGQVPVVPGLPLYTGTAAQYSAAVLVKLLAIKQDIARQAIGIAQAFGALIQHVKHGDPTLQIIVGGLVMADTSSGNCAATIPVVGGVSGMQEGDTFQAKISKNGGVLTLANPFNVSIEDPNGSGGIFVTTGVSLNQPGASVIWMWDAKNSQLEIVGG